MIHEVRDEHGKGKELRNTKDTLEDMGVKEPIQPNNLSC
jgi:hypothetical protein